MKDIEQKVVEVIDQLQSLAKPAMATAIDAVRVSGAMYLITGAICAVLCYFAARACAVQCQKASDANYNDDTKHVVFAGITGIIGLGFGIATCVNLLDPSNWLAMVRPDLYLARALLTRVL